MRGRNCQIIHQIRKRGYSKFCSNLPIRSRVIRKKPRALQPRSPHTNVSRTFYDCCSLTFPLSPAQTESRTFYDCCLKMIAAYARHQSSLRAATADASAEEDSFSDLLLLMELLTNMLTKDIIDLGGHDGTARGGGSLVGGVPMEQRWGPRVEMARPQSLNATSAPCFTQSAFVCMYGARTNNFCGVVRDVRKGREGRPPLEFSGLCFSRAKTPAKASEIHTEVTKSVRKPTKKARPDSRGPSDHLGLPRKRANQKNRVPLSTRAPLNIRTPLSIRAPLSIRGPSESSGTPLSHKGPL